jgi:hypothetical protein
MVRCRGCTAGALEARVTAFVSTQAQPGTPNALSKLVLLLLRWFGVKYAPRALACEHAALRTMEGALQSAVLLVWCPRMLNLHPACTLQAGSVIVGMVWCCTRTTRACL